MAVNVNILKSEDTNASQDTRESIKIPAVMYHSILNNKKGVYIVSEKQLESDLLAFKKSGYTTVFPTQIIDYVKNGSKLPDKPLLITFDDGHYNNMLYALPLLKKHNEKAVINIIGRFSNHSTASGDHSNPQYSHLTWSQIKKLKLSECFEIGSHSYNMHNYKPRFGIAQKKDETLEEYCLSIKNDIMLLQDKLNSEVGVTPNVFAYPFGEYCETAKNLLVAFGFEMLLTSNEGISKVTKWQPNSILELKRINRNGSFTSLELLSKINSFL
ncbi:MAG: polysaccharide deacetylase family protein [Clostridia bacterium]|nr:polysaccharide deacetylase family protein [Clostridia bacterium]